MNWSNPRTTLMGYILCLGALVFIGMHAYQGNLSLNDLVAVGGLVGGTGLINATDGSH